MDNIQNDERVLVPCEFCEQMIDFDQYVQHATTCVHRRVQPNSTVLIVQDEGETYRIILDEALAAFNAHLNLMGSAQVPINSAGEQDEANHTLNENDGNVSEVEDEDEADNGEESHEEYHRVRLPPHRSLVVVPRLANGIFPEMRDMNDYEFNLLLSDRIGKVKTGIKKDDLHKYITCVTQIDNSDDICPVCREDLAEYLKDNKVMETPCHHKYCKDCIEMWLQTNKKCPVCQTDVEDTLTQKEN
jgi:hypothetical protein